jgi:hypothetical protein
MTSGERGRVGRTARRLRAVAFAGIGCVVGGVWWTVRASPSFHGDSANVVRGSANVVECLRHHRFTGCDGLVLSQHGADHLIHIHPYPLLQYVVGVPLQAGGLSQESTLHVLAVVSAVSLVAILFLSYRAVRRFAPPMWAPLVTVALLASPLLWYGKSAFGEELAAAVILAAVVGVLYEVPPGAIAALVALACITKETNPPFVLALTGICVLARTSTRDPLLRRRLVAIGVGTAVGITMNAGFNIFRYDSVRNTTYMRSGLIVRDFRVAGRLFAAQWFAPNGGLVWFWLLAPALLLTVAVSSWRRRRSTTWESVAAPFVALLLIAQVLLLSTWWSPFGWFAWGPRLVLPLIPAMLVAVCVLGAPGATPTFARFLRGRGLVPAGVVVVALGLPQATAVFRGRAVSEFFASNTCHRGYYPCLYETAWSRRPWMLQVGLRGLDTTSGGLLAVAWAAAVVCLLLYARELAGPEVRDPRIDIARLDSPTDDHRPERSRRASDPYEW